MSDQTIGHGAQRDQLHAFTLGVQKGPKIIQLSFGEFKGYEDAPFFEGVRSEREIREAAAKKDEAAARFADNVQKMGEVAVQGQDETVNNQPIIEGDN